MQIFTKPSSGAACLVYALVTLLAASAGLASAQAKYSTGDRVLCNVVGMTDPKYEKYYEKGTVLAFRRGDGEDGSWYRVKADSNGVEYYCKLDVLRPLAAAAVPPAAPATAAAPAAPATLAVPKAAAAPAAPQAPAQRDAPALTAFVQCPVAQPPSRNGARPDPALLMKLIRCAKGEKPVPPGQEGAVQVAVSAVQVGTSRPWSYRQDKGNGQVDTLVYPVKATYTVRTLYRAATEVEEDWIRILNVYVNPFGEWQIGSEEPIKPGAARRIPIH